MKSICNSIDNSDYENDINYFIRKCVETDVKNIIIDCEESMGKGMSVPSPASSCFTIKSVCVCPQKTPAMHWVLLSLQMR